MVSLQLIIFFLEAHWQLSRDARAFGYLCREGLGLIFRTLTGTIGIFVVFGNNYVAFYT